MLIEQSLVNPNFIGKDSFRWFVGQVTKFKNTENGYKVKVRIIGHHPDAASIVKDEDLPWAHVLVPLNMGAGEGGTGVSFNPRGSETVIGFFADGEDGQQPIIIGSLFSGATIVHPNGWDEGTNGFNPFKAEPGSQPNGSNIIAETGKPPGDSGTIPNADGTITDKNGENKRTQRQEAAKQNENTVVSSVSSCKSGNDVFSKITKALRQFIKVLNTVNVAIDVYVNPALNLIADIPSLLNEAAQAIGDGLSEYIKFARDEIIKRVYKLLKGEIEKLLPKDLGILKKIATDKIVDGIWCAFQNILKRVFSFATDFLKQLIKTVVNIPLCAAESFVGSLTQTITNEIQNALGPIIQQIASTLGGAVGQVSSFVGKAISYAQLALSFLSCEDASCKEEFDYEMNKGYIPKTDPNFQKIASYRPSTGVNNLFNDSRQQAQTWLASVGAGGDGEFDSELQGECDASVFRCGLPNVTIFGGGGSGAKGKTVVDVFGQVMGINLLDPGSGYTTAPYVSIDDSCESGSGATAFAVLGGPSGGIERIVVDTPGSGYLGPNDLGGPFPSDIVRNVGGIDLGDDFSSCAINPIDEDGNQVVGFIESIVVLSTGIGYSEDDIITNIICNSDFIGTPKLDSNGRIIGVNIINPGTAIRVSPRLTINTENGFGAVLLPVLGFKAVEDPTPETNRQLVQKVILCAEDHE
jgi:hypothetical protein